MSLLAFLILNAIILIAIGAGVFATYAKLDRPTAAKNTRVIMFWIVVWLAALSGAVKTGYALENPMPGIPMLFLTVVLTSIAFAFSPIGKKLSYGVPVAFLVLFQSFRLPLELILHEWASQGVIPTTMTWTGQNLDIATGVLAIVAFPFAGKYRSVARVFNIIGLGFLLNVMRVAILSSPGPFGWNVEPKMQLITHVPYALIGPVCVGGALIGHILLMRALFVPERLEIKSKEPKMEHA